MYDGFASEFKNKDFFAKASLLGKNIMVGVGTIAVWGASDFLYLALEIQ